MQRVVKLKYRKYWSKLINVVKKRKYESYFKKVNFFKVIKNNTMCKALAPSWFYFLQTPSWRLTLIEFLVKRFIFSLFLMNKLIFAEAWLGSGTSIGHWKGSQACSGIKLVLLCYQTIKLHITTLYLPLKICLLI